MLPESCQLLRDACRVEVSATDIVPGDAVFVKAGSKIPADLRFIEVSHDFTLDRSIVTGKWTQLKSRVPALKSHKANRTPSKGVPTQPPTTILKQDVLVFKELTVFLAMRLVWL